MIIKQTVLAVAISAIVMTSASAAIGSRITGSGAGELSRQEQNQQRMDQLIDDSRVKTAQRAAEIKVIHDRLKAYDAIPASQKGLRVISANGDTTRYDSTREVGVGTKTNSLTTPLLAGKSGSCIVSYDTTSSINPGFTWNIKISASVNASGDVTTTAQMISASTPVGNIQVSGPSFSGRGWVATDTWRGGLSQSFSYDERILYPSLPSVVTAEWEGVLDPYSYDSTYITQNRTLIPGALANLFNKVPNRVITKTFSSGDLFFSVGSNGLGKAQYALQSIGNSGTGVINQNPAYSVVALLPEIIGTQRVNYLDGYLAGTSSLLKILEDSGDGFMMVTMKTVLNRGSALGFDFDLNTATGDGKSLQVIGKIFDVIPRASRRGGSYGRNPKTCVIEL